MTVINNDARDQYTATNGQTIFNYTFEISSQNNIQVYQRAAGSEPNDTADLLTLTVDYTVTGVGVNTGGTIILNSGATLADIVTLQGNAPPVRSTTFTPGGVIQAANLNTEFDDEILIYQTILGVQDFLIPKYAKSAIVAAVDLVLPILDEDQTWVMNSTRTAIVAADFPSEGAASKLGTYVTITDETAQEPNSFPLSAISTGFMVNRVGTSDIVTRTMVGTAHQIDISNPTGSAANPTFSISDNPRFNGTTDVGIPMGTTAERVIPVGYVGLRYNTDLQQFEFYDGGWYQLEDSSDIATLLALLASHTAGEGASLIGLEDQGSVSGKTVQDLAEAGLIAKTDNGTLVNGQFLAALSTGILKSTTTTGVLSISAGLTSIDGLTTIANNMLYTTALNTYAVIAPANNAAMVSSAGGVPSWSATLPTAVQDNITNLGAMAEALNMNSHLINNVTDPVSAQDAATKFYVDTLIASVAKIFSARLASTTALTVTYANGSSGVGATLTNAGVQAALTLDGVAAVAGNLVVIKDQASTLQNGYYSVTDIGSGATNWVLTRSTLYDTPSEIEPGDLFIITAGSTQANTSWIQTAVVTAVGTDPITFSQYSVALPIPISQGGTGATTVADARTNLGLGTMAVQNANAVAITGGTIVGLTDFEADNIKIDGNAIQHLGDLNNQIVFGTDTQSFETGGVSRLDLSDTGMRLGAANSRVTTILDEDAMGSDSATALATQQSIKAYADTKFKQVNIQVFSASGTYTPTSGMKYCIIETIGGGAGGGGSALSTGGSGAGGGASGGYSRKFATAATVGASQTVTIGAGGAGGTAGNNNGADGGTTSVGTICVANGGYHGLGAAANGAGFGGDFATTGTGDIVSAGNGGDSGTNAALSTYGSVQGSGGGGFLGGGARSGVANVTYGGSGPIAGSYYGGGGGGGGSANSSAAMAGGAGFGGAVIITEYL